MKEIKSKLNYTMPPATAKKKIGDDPISILTQDGLIKRKNRSSFYWEIPSTSLNNLEKIKTLYSSVFILTRQDLWQIMDQGNWKVADITKMIGKPEKTVKRWAKRNADGKYQIPMTGEQYKILHKKLMEKLVIENPPNIGAEILVYDENNELIKDI